MDSILRGYGSCGQKAEARSLQLREDRTVGVTALFSYVHVLTGSEQCCKVVVMLSAFVF
jgi:hypothetical protein